MSQYTRSYTKFQPITEIRIVYERVRYVYTVCNSVHNHTRSLKNGQANAGERGMALGFFLEEL